MTTQKWFLFLFASVFFASSCFIDDDENIFGCTDGSGELVTDTLNFDNFTGVDLRCPGKVFLTQGDSYEVVVETQENIQDEIEVELDNDVLEIEIDECIVDYTLRVYITMPEVDYLKVAGSGEMVSENELEGEFIELRISGSGELDLGLSYEEVKGKISGSGDMLLEGTTEIFDFKISGSGDLSAFDLEAEQVFVTISGSGDAEVFASDLLDVKISGSGNVIYDGSPTDIFTDISGSGDIEPR